MKTIEERFKSKGINPKSKYHSYDYLYKSIVELMQEYEHKMDVEIAKKFVDEPIEKSRWLQI